ncbi:restriction endonuclease [Rhodovulum sulfidophilum]|uniref:restriction endonuclease n=1 Tax=Rhodovulum sulfidophilum TaxID=35806 RepID=UPI0019242DF7|nr:restriction endonuclease [Rhodovulum sulfidophilum]MBL3572471.1 restriction endonuclease [Rhodovulum sulfidophilum]MCE8431734.1 restriction endonuclease [Rhodovulum sulfidophilum]MCF4116548.1 restriction endonuclease [Rhodovulum sulfidophilum]
MIPDFQTLMRPVLQSALGGERRVSDVVEEMSVLFELTPEDRAEVLPSGRQGRMANRVHWARGYLKQAGLVRSPRRGHFELTEEGRRALKEAPERITKAWLERYPSYLEFKNRTKGRAAEGGAAQSAPADPIASDATPEEILTSAHEEIQTGLAAELLGRLREGSPRFFEETVVKLLVAMGYGGPGGRSAVLGGSGDNGVDGVIDKDPLGVDQVYVQAKRYGEGATVGSGEIRDFFGALSLKDVTRGVFVTTARFSPSAHATAEKLGARIVLVDGPRLADLMIAYEIGCQVRQTFRLHEIDEDFFE